MNSLDGMVEWVCKCGNSYKHFCGRSLPPSERPAVFWEGLSADEISDLIPSTDLSGDYGYGDMFAVARLVEYKLREKNEKKNKTQDVESDRPDNSCNRGGIDNPQGEVGQTPNDGVLGT